MQGRGKPARAALVGAALACGDPGDIEVPFAPRAPRREAVPLFPRAPARAFAKLEITDEAGLPGACPLHFTSSLGKPCAQLETDDATCDPVRDGEDASVSCSVSPLSTVPDVYDLELDLQHEFLPVLAITGPLNAIRSSRITLNLVTPDGTQLQADCNASALAIQPGAARFRSNGCATRIDDNETPSCDVSLTAGVEQCGG